MEKVLNFTKNVDLYIARDYVNDDYNVHVELNEVGTVSINHKTSGDKYAPVHTFTGVTVVDDDFDGIVYPKNIEIASTKPVSKAIIKENG